MDGGAGLEAAQVAAWLRAHPDFMAGQPELYRLLAPPRRLHGEPLADHMAAMLASERAATQHLAAAARAEDGFIHRVHQAVLALITTPNPAEAVVHEWPALLGLAHCTLAAEGATLPHWRPLPAGSLARLLPAGRDTLLRQPPAEATLLHGEAAPLIAHDALARLPWNGAPALLVLGAREATHLPRHGATAPLRFLAAAVAASLAR